MGIEQTMEGFRPPGQFEEMAFQHLREGIEQRPGVPRPEGFVERLAPLVKHARNELVGTHADIDGPDNEIMCGPVFDLGDFVGHQPAVLVMPALHEFSHGALDEARQVAVDVRGVFPGQLHLATEGQVVANKGLRSSDDAGRKRFVVRVSQAQDPAVVLGGLVPLDLHETEVAGALVAQAMGLGADDEAIGFQRAFDLRNEFEVRNGCPCLRGVGCRDELDDFAAFRESLGQGSRKRGPMAGGDPTFEMAKP